MADKVNIIGAGVTGLSAGCYLQLNGYDTQIFEQHSRPGGLCTSWKRRGYLFDGCIHWLVGTSPSHELYPLWNELVDMEKLSFVEFDEHLRVEDGQGNDLRIWSDVDRLEAELLVKAPDDARLIRDLCRGVRAAARLRIPVDKAPELYGLRDLLGLARETLPQLAALARWTRVSVNELADRCKSSLLGRALRALIVPEMSVFFLLVTLGWMHRRCAAYPIGGSLRFAQQLVDRYERLGGQIQYGTGVERILTSGGKGRNSVRGIRLANGESHPADIVVSAADGHATYFRMLDGSLVSSEVRAHYARLDTFPSFVLASYGVARPLDDMPHASVIPSRVPIRIDPATLLEDLAVRIYNFDPTLAPDGKTVLNVLVPTRGHEHWESLRQSDRATYKQEKERIAQELFAEVDHRLGNISRHLEVTDVSTPATFIRYTGNWRGSYEGWLPTVKLWLRPPKKVLPKLDGFFHAGQWVEPGGGLPSAILSGRNVTQLICRRDSRTFRAGT